MRNLELAVFPSLADYFVFMLAPNEQFPEAEIYVPRPRKPKSHAESPSELPIFVDTGCSYLARLNYACYLFMLDFTDRSRAMKPTYRYNVHHGVIQNTGGSGVWK